MATRLTNASVSLEACRAVLSQTGQHDAVNALRGLEVLDPTSARIALGLLRGIQVYGDMAGTAKFEAISVLEAAADEVPALA